VEVAASVAILGGVILGILVARNRALAAHAEADQMLSCTRLCAEQVAALRAGLAGAGGGEVATPSGRFEWRITISTMAEDPTTAALTAYHVTVRPARVFSDHAAADSAPAQADADDEIDDPRGASVTLWLPPKPVPAKEKSKEAKAAP
jgi:hypothetical protein